MIKEKPIYFSEVSQCVDRIVETVGKTIVFGMPLALGKPNHLVNALYRRAKSDPEIRLTILTALSLERPQCSGELEQRFMDPHCETTLGWFRGIRLRGGPAQQ